MGSSVQGLFLIVGWKKCLKEEVADHVGGGLDNPFDLAILRGSVGTRELQLNTMGKKEGARGRVVKLAAVIALKSMNRATELGGDPSEEVGEGGKAIGLEPLGKSLGKMREIIYGDQVVYVTRESEDRRSLEITMDKIKGLSSSGHGSRERKTRVAAKLTCMTKALRGSLATRYIRATRELGHDIRARVIKMTMPNGGGGGSSKSMGENTSAGEVDGK
jgi:hypothetical protein